MTLEKITELARAAGTAEAWCGGPLSEHLTMGELSAIVAKVYPLIAAEMAGEKQREYENNHRFLFESRASHSCREQAAQNAEVCSNLVAAVLAHAAKMGEKP